MHYREIVQYIKIDQCWSLEGRSRMGRWSGYWQSIHLLLAHKRYVSGDMSLYEIERLGDRASPIVNVTRIDIHRESVRIASILTEVCIANAHNGDPE